METKQQSQRPTMPPPAVCPQCGLKYNPRRPACPRCGYPNDAQHKNSQTKNVAKTRVPLLIALLIVAVALAILVTSLTRPSTQPESTMAATPSEVKTDSPVATAQAEQIKSLLNRFNKNEELTASEYGLITSAKAEELRQNLLNAGHFDDIEIDDVAAFKYLKLDKSEEYSITVIYDREDGINFKQAAASLDPDPSTYASYQRIVDYMLDSIEYPGDKDSFYKNLTARIDEIFAPDSKKTGIYGDIDGVDVHYAIATPKAKYISTIFTIDVK